MTLTLQNYFTNENKYLTNSKISDYVKSPNYFYKKHILGEIEKKATRAMVIGSGVDYLLAQDDAKPEYRIVERKNLKNPPEGYTEVNQSEYDEIFEIADAVSKTSVFADIDKNFQKQVILKKDEKIGEHFIGLAGIPDYIRVTDDEIIIVDIKTARTTDKRKYYWHCKEFRYFEQQAHYQSLAEEIYPGRKCTSYHLVVDKIKDIYNVALFKLNQDEIERAKIDMQFTINEIAENVDFAKKDITWSSAITLTPFDEGEDWEDDND